MWTLCGRYVDAIWTLCGRYMEAIWTLYGIYSLTRKGAKGRNA